MKVEKRTAKRNNTGGPRKDTQAFPKKNSEEISDIFIGGVSKECQEGSWILIRYVQLLLLEVRRSRLSEDRPEPQPQYLQLTTGNPKRFAIVTFKKPICRSVLSQVHRLNEKILDVREFLSEQASEHRLCNEKSRKIFVGGLPTTVDQSRFCSRSAAGRLLLAVR